MIRQKTFPTVSQVSMFAGSVPGEKVGLPGAIRATACCISAPAADTADCQPPTMQLAFHRGRYHAAGYPARAAAERQSKH